MNRDDIIRMARKVWGDQAVLPINDLERFAALVVAAEREECAKLCDVITGKMIAERKLAEQIRGRGMQ